MKVGDKLIDVVVVTAITLVSLLAAYVTFRVLDSSAAGDVGGISVGGGIAGFVVIGSLLFGQYGQLRKSSGDVEKLQRAHQDEVAELRRDHKAEIAHSRQEKEELQAKLLRSVPKPEAFDLEIDERQHLVLARPSAWKPQGGVIFDFELPTTEGDGDVYPARFKLSYEPIRDETRDADAYYEKLRADAEEAHERTMLGAPSTEFVFLGQDQEHKSFKLIACEYYELKRQVDPLTGKTRRLYSQLDRSECDALRNGHERAGEEVEGNGNGNGNHEPLVVQRMSVVCHHAALGTIFRFDFWDDDKDFAGSSALFNRLLYSARFLT